MEFNISIVGIIFSILSIVTGKDHGKGWNDNIDWVSYEDGLKAIKEQQKPMMLIIHKTWCGACKRLKPRFAEDKTIEELSKDFIMVNVQDEEEPLDKQFSPDGGYIPRILFLDTEGKVDTSIVNRFGNPSYRYFYPMTSHVVDSMKDAKGKLMVAKKRGADEL